MKVLVIPEDPKLDQYILKPVVARIFADLGKSPRIEVLSNPRLRGVAEALDGSVLADVVATFPMAERAPKFSPGEGRAWAMRELGSQWRGVLRRCPELGELKLRIENRLRDAS